jgi:hypothetical protein
MLTIVVGGQEVFDEESQEFGVHGGVTLYLEHSLISLSKWEAKFEKPFLSTNEMTDEESLEYIKCMTITRNVPDETYAKLSGSDLKQIEQYIGAKMTATWFSEKSPKSRRGEVVTSELIYYWMTVFGIPFECEKWHLARLFALIQICNNKQEKPKKISRSELAQRNRELNAQRKKELGTRG